MKKLWDYLSGKKSAIAATLNAVLLWVIINRWIDDNTAMMVASILSAWTGLAVGHSVAKGIQK